ncbi:uncharacterized protein LOC143241634 isoform X2 [Tachypleus tridentatus]|uniref:uncharacterized protein LOC143241634 isoform X2 n=1 Tax=Tachypleus tridentatus TaxID=6853 RepID=UPI003FD1F6D7
MLTLIIKSVLRCRVRVVALINLNLDKQSSESVQRIWLECYFCKRNKPVRKHTNQVFKDCLSSGTTT